MHPASGWEMSDAMKPRLWREWAWFYLSNCLVTVVLQSGYIVGISSGLHGVARLAFALALVSQAGFLNLIPALFTVWPLLRWRHRTGARLLAGTLYAFLQVALLADIVIFRLFQRHFDSLVWNVLTTKGAGDSVRVDPASVVTATAIVFMVIGASLAFALWGVPGLVRRRPRFGLAAILIALLVERTFFAAIDLRDNSTVQAVRDTLPLYQPLTIKHLARKFGYKRPPGAIRVLPDSGKSLHLPQHPLGLRLDAREPNILFIVVEGGRADALDQKTMPNLSSLADDSFRLTKNFSTGNETRFGIFGLLYGIPGTYWTPVLTQSLGPPWFDLLASRGYEFRIMSCTDLNYPEFRQTCFVKLTNDITDHWNAPHQDRDRLMTDKFLNYLAERAGQPAPAHPFFGFLFFDASHQPYEHPLQDNLYEGSNSGEINYLKLTLSPAGAKALKGSYLNSLHYIDRQIGRIVKGLQDRGEYGRTVIVVAGDHGEEFGELGHFGHCCSFNRFQTETFGVLHLPGENPRVVDHVTSHVDFVPSVLTWMGITNALGDYTTGEPIEGPETRNWALLAGWQDTALFNEDCITIFKPSRTLYLDLSDHELSKGDPRFASKSSETLQALNEIRRFLR
ncbi:MAG TPA: sulfatase-like hydrolase/transferase [Candidatus Acidoferrum sp.]|nr:sulfatase-like hydrolase/transferase [Candidatus Acidoferrum sp.]